MNHDRAIHYATGDRYCAKCAMLTEEAVCPLCLNVTRAASARDRALAQTTIVYIKPHRVKVERLTHGGPESRV